MPDVTAEFARQRLAHLESLATELAARGLASRMLGTGAPVLWVWHPRSGRQTIVFAGPAADGWLFCGRRAARGVPRSRSTWPTCSESCWTAPLGTRLTAESRFLDHARSQITGAARVVLHPGRRRQGQGSEKGQVKVFRQQPRSGCEAMALRGRPGRSSHGADEQPRCDPDSHRMMGADHSQPPHPR